MYVHLPLPIFYAAGPLLHGWADDLLDEPPVEGPRLRALKAGAAEDGRPDGDRGLDPGKAVEGTGHRGGRIIPKGKNCNKNCPRH